MMDQTHIGYTFWNEPPLNAMPAVTEVQPVSGPRMAVAVEGSPFATSRDLDSWRCLLSMSLTGKLSSSMPSIAGLSLLNFPQARIGHGSS